MGVESGKDKVKVKPKPKRKVAMVVKPAETQDQHDTKIRLRQKKLDNKATRKKAAVKKVDGTPEDVARIRKVHTRKKLKLKTAVAVRLETRGEYAFMLKAGVRLKLGKILQVKLRQELKIEGVPGKRTVQPYKLKLETSVLGAVLGIEGYQQKNKKKMYFGYTVRSGTLKIVFLGQYAKTPEKGVLSARMKLSKKLSERIKLFADVTLSNPDKPGSMTLSDVEGAVGISLPNNQSLKLYMNPGDRRFTLTYFGRF